MGTWRDIWHAHTNLPQESVEILGAGRDRWGWSRQGLGALSQATNVTSQSCDTGGPREPPRRTGDAAGVSAHWKRLGERCLQAGTWRAQTW